MTLYDAVLQRLKQIMSEKNASLYTLNKEGGIPKSTLSQVLNKKQKKIKLDLLYDILSTMGVTLQEFFTDPIFEEVTDKMNTPKPSGKGVFFCYERRTI